MKLAGSCIEYSTVLQVPNSPDAVLLKKLAQIEPKLSKLTGYSVKLMEKSCIPLIRLFSRVFVGNNCHWKDCQVCDSNTTSRSSKCRKII